MKQEFDEVGRGYWNAPDLDVKGSSASGVDVEFREPCLKDEANLISSKCHDGMHRPVLDIDVPARYVPSSTPGHGHLYIDVPLSWDQYEKLLVALTEAGILQFGYLSASKYRQSTFVRPEWIKKPESAPKTTTYAIHDMSAFRAAALAASEGAAFPRPPGTITPARSAIYCEHANEVPMGCPCAPGCYCKDHTCRLSPTDETFSI
jgi:hypothetical protein